MDVVSELLGDELHCLAHAAGLLLLFARGVVPIPVIFIIITRCNSSFLGYQRVPVADFRGAFAPGPLRVHLCLLHTQLLQQLVQPVAVARHFLRCCHARYSDRRERGV